jgi:hypothetical protein
MDGKHQYYNARDKDLLPKEDEILPATKRGLRKRPPEI